MSSPLHQSQHLAMLPAPSQLAPNTRNSASSFTHEHVPSTSTLPSSVIAKAASPTPVDKRRSGQFTHHAQRFVSPPSCLPVPNRKLTWPQSIFLNPHVWENCTNVYKDYYYCVRPVGYISTYLGYLPTTSTKEFVQTPTTPLPLEHDPFADYVSTNPVIPLANKTREDCHS
jgi:hypothetical protein